MPAIPYLVPEFVSVAPKNSVPHSGVHFPLFVLGFAHSRIFRLFRVFCLFRLFRFSRVQIRNSLLGAPNPEFRGHSSGHVWCGHVWRALCKEGLSRGSGEWHLIPDPQTRLAWPFACWICGCGKLWENRHEPFHVRDT